jgi:hypothetical protein
MVLEIQQSEVIVVVHAEEEWLPISQIPSSIRFKIMENVLFNCNLKLQISRESIGGVRVHF